MDKPLMSFLDEQAVYLEKERLKYVRLSYLYKITRPIKSILKVVLVLMAVINFIFPLILPSFIGLGVIFVVLWAFNNPKDTFEFKLKEKVLPTVVKKVNDSFKYVPLGYNHKSLQDSEFLSKGFFANTIKIQGEDYVGGKIENIDVEFFELKFSKEITNYTKTTGGCLLSILLLPVVFIKNIFDNDNSDDDIVAGVIKDEKVFFSGLFMNADFHKEFKGKIIMIPKKKDTLKDKIYEIFEPQIGTKINVENPYINEHYNIYVSDIQTGFYVLSQNLINRIHLLSEQENALPIISFINSKMYFVIPWKKNLFDFNLTTKIENGNYFLPYIEEINSFEKIIKDLSLDTRIWSKV
ncbi:DUF3137 domain-containing protein [Flavobacterium sp. PLA-1-15]|uniref:DUF3137 domain-containing protein n=1 Tax=Flavobacterium sp. PLA-1-15 TaxID=3380533 RepID=UPI003B82866F